MRSPCTTTPDLRPAPCSIASRSQRTRSTTFALAIPLDGSVAPPTAQKEIESILEQTEAGWRETLNHTSIRIANAQPLVDTLRTALADILISRDGPGAAPGHALVRTLVDPRRRDDVGCAAAPRTRRRSARLSPMVCAVPVQERQGALLRRRTRLRSGARKRQPRRADLSCRRDLSLHRRPHAARIDVAARRRRDRATWIRLRESERGERRMPSFAASCRRRSATKAIRRSRCIRTGTISGR